MQAYSAINDNTCGWTHTAIEPSPNFPKLTEDRQVDWVIVGAGFTGIAAAYQLSALHPNDCIIIIDAEKAGAGASSRNSGYIVDVTLNDGGSSLADDQTQLAKSTLNLMGLKQLQNQVEQYNIQCDWDKSGKFHCAADSKNISKLHSFEEFLNHNGIPFKSLNRAALHERLGTNYYQYAVQTTQGVLVNPASLVNGLLNNLPSNVAVYERSPVINIKSGELKTLTTSNGTLRTQNVIIAVNALMPRLGLKQNKVFPLTLTASLSKPLNDQELRAINHPKPWGVLSASSMGATVRLTNDNRIMVRNTVEWQPSLTMDTNALNLRREKHYLGLRKRFPALSNLEFEYSWSGNVCISRNSKPVFEKADEGVYIAGCYNAGGIAMGSLFGKLIADYASGKESDALEQVLNQTKPTSLPPRPFFDLGLITRLAWQRFHGKAEA